MPTWQTADGHTGTHSVQVTNPTASSGTHGLNPRPVPVGPAAEACGVTGRADDGTGRPVTIR